MEDIRLIVFIKNKILSKVKTRLAKDIGDEEALSAYTHLLQQTTKLCKSLESIHISVYYDQFIEQEDEWTGICSDRFVQKGEDLGERMYAAFKDGEDNFTKQLIIGSDCPYLSSRHIHAAVQKLDEVDTVIGPARDGGYYLLGVKRVRRHLFENISWSTDQVLKQTVACLHQHQDQVELLETLSDIDTLQDWNDYLTSRQNLNF